jgi:outer membrane protein assembly factor BamB
MSRIKASTGYIVTIALACLALNLGLPGCGGKYDKPLEYYKEYQVGLYRYGAPLLGFEAATHMAVTGGHLFISYENDSALLDFYSLGAPNSNVEFEGVIRPTIVGEGARAIAVAETEDSLSVKVFRPGGGQPILTFSDPDWVEIGGLAIDDDDNVYVADAARNFVRSYDIQGRRRFEIDLADSGFGIGHVMTPRGLHFDGEHLLIAEADDEKAQVQRIRVDEPQQGVVFSPTVPFLSSFTDSVGNEIALVRPVGVSTDADGNVYVLDQGLGKVYRYTPEGVSFAEVNSPLIAGPAVLFDAVAIGTYQGAVFAFERDTGTIHVWYSTEQSTDQSTEQ